MIRGKLRFQIVLAFLLAGGLSAQEYRGRVQGVVTDSTQAIVAGATVTLRNVATGVAATRQTDMRGRYIFDLIEPGGYSVMVELEGFNRFLRENILVQNRSDITVDAQLHVGGVTETVTVSGSPVSVQFNTTSMEVTLDHSMVENLPLVERNP